MLPGEKYQLWKTKSRGFANFREVISKFRPKMRRSKITTIARLTNESSFRYWLTEPTELAIHGLDADGNAVRFVLADHALMEIARMIRTIENTFPAALRGH